MTERTHTLVLLVGMARTMEPNTREVKIKVAKCLMNSILTGVKEG
jgi:hypothetical protein